MFLPDFQIEIDGNINNISDPYPAAPTTSKFAYVESPKVLFTKKGSPDISSVSANSSFPSITLVDTKKERREASSIKKEIENQSNEEVLQENPNVTTENHEEPIKMDEMNFVSFSGQKIIGLNELETEKSQEKEDSGESESEEGSESEESYTEESQSDTGRDRNYTSDPNEDGSFELEEESHKKKDFWGVLDQGSLKESKEVYDPKKNSLQLKRGLTEKEINSKAPSKFQIKQQTDCRKGGFVLQEAQIASSSNTQSQAEKIRPTAVNKSVKSGSNYSSKASKEKGYGTGGSEQSCVSKTSEDLAQVLQLKEFFLDRVESLDSQMVTSEETLCDDSFGVHKKAQEFSEEYGEMIEEDEEFECEECSAEESFKENHPWNIPEDRSESLSSSRFASKEPLANFNGRVTEPKNNLLNQCMNVPRLQMEKVNPQVGENQPLQKKAMEVCKKYSDQFEKRRSMNRKVSPCQKENTYGQLAYKGVKTQAKVGPKPQREGIFGKLMKSSGQDLASYGQTCLY